MQSLSMHKNYNVKTKLKVQSARYLLRVQKKNQIRMRLLLIMECNFAELTVQFYNFNRDETC